MMWWKTTNVMLMPVGEKDFFWRATDERCCHDQNQMTTNFSFYSTSTLNSPSFWTMSKPRII